MEAGRAIRFRPSVGPFAAAADASADALHDLVALVPAGEEIVLVEPGIPILPPSMICRQSLATDQMVAIDLPAAEAEPRLIALGEDDAPAMRALAALTRPGPFAQETHRLGRFVGVREDGRLVAMAGERLRLDGFTEASAVCTHPDARGRGLARRLLIAVMHAIAARGETPFLHVYATNVSAIALYEQIGFRRRATLQAITLARA